MSGMTVLTWYCANIGDAAESADRRGTIHLLFAGHVLGQTENTSMHALDSHC